MGRLLALFALGLTLAAQQPARRPTKPVRPVIERPLARPQSVSAEAETRLNAARETHREHVKRTRLAVADKRK